VGIAVAVVAWLWSNAIHNLSGAPGFSTGFAFSLVARAGMPIVDNLVALQSEGHLSARPSWSGSSTRLRVAAIGVVLATVLGTMIGIARLSSNWLFVAGSPRFLCRSAGATFRYLLQTSVLVRC